MKRNKVESILSGSGDATDLPKDEVQHFLTNLKLIFQNGVLHSKNKTRLHRLLAIHNCHYVVEQMLRERAKNMIFKGSALHKLGFEEIIKKVSRTKTIPDYNHLLDLNRIRNEAEHMNIIPDVETVGFYVTIVKAFLQWSYEKFFNVDYESLAFEDMIYDNGIKKVMLEAKEFIQEGDLKRASAKIYEGLGAFKFLSFGFLSDPRAQYISFKIPEPFKEVKLSSLLADLGFKIILAQDETALKKLMPIKTMWTWSKNGQLRVRSHYPQPPFKDKQEAMEHYEDILSIVLTYQDRFPSWVWRKK